jgi:hypothetical protein
MFLHWEKLLFQGTFGVPLAIVTEENALIPIDRL